ncbi:unnamed protein product [Tetraodon nigroviridis]|uniref:(spotted green pufferfish) hypothetical protein n=1 Tax=Tetraodon nigroviridis TaxID=99883 RepID=Q4RUM0_TETNG|nr:unnamed protein product [Tetraodon nigroviridis]
MPTFQGLGGGKLGSRTGGRQRGRRSQGYGTKVRATFH